MAIIPAVLVYGDRATFRHSVLLRLGAPIPWADLAGQGADPEAVDALTARIRTALKPLTLHDADVRRWLPGAALRLAAALALLPPGLLFWPPYRPAGWVAGRGTDEGDQTATLKLLGGLLVLPLWGAILALAAGFRWGWVNGLVPPVALLAAGLGLPILERVAEDLQAIRGFLRRRDPAVPDLLEARRQLVAAFPELAGR